ncbi:MAG: hypothetical protein Q4C64_07765 [Erysipelotrichia bacterium]|nr:hypothetical protein [Erysipelotrichia bacterium]
MAMHNILVDGDDEQTENYHLISDDERRVWERAHDHAEKAINEWTKTLNDIMNMNVEEINAKDVKQRFKETKKYGIYING